jgi:hypothetical protein
MFDWVGMAAPSPFRYRTAFNRDTRIVLITGNVYWERPPFTPPFHLGPYLQQRVALQAHNGAGGSKV